MKKASWSTGIVAVLCLGILITAFVYVYEMQNFMQAGQAQQGLASFQTQPAQTIELDGKAIRVFVASNDEERQLGLGGMSGLAPDEGMLFVFQQDGEYAFWMKDMSFSIDMVWISDNGRVVYIVQNALPQSYPENFVPTSPARYVLELPADYTKTNDVKVGDVVEFQ